MQAEIALEIRNQFLEGMSHAACTVNIITTDGPAGRAGVTVSAMSSVSADTPSPTLLVCVHQKSAAAQKIIDNAVFCVNVLRDDQAYISETFAGRLKQQITDKFSCAKWTSMLSGSPRVIDPLVAFDCRLKSSSLVGTHHVLLGEVKDIFIADKGSPLIYANRAYGSTMLIDHTPQSVVESDRKRGRLSLGCFHTFGPYFLPAVLQRMMVHDPSCDFHLVEGDQDQLLESLDTGEVEIALLYDIDLTDNLDVVPLVQLFSYVLLAQGHPLADRSAIAPEHLADYPMVLLDAPPSAEYFTSILKSHGVDPKIAYRSSSFEMVRGLVGHGLGYTLLATKPASPMTYDGRALVSRPLAADVAPSRIMLVRLRSAKLSERAEKFATLCREYFSGPSK